jgi:hypothetical protein
MPGFSALLRGLVPSVVVAAAVLCGVTASFGAEGYWRYVDTRFNPTQAELDALAHGQDRADEKHVSGGFQPEYSGQGTLELYFKNDDVDRHVFVSRLTLTYGASTDITVLVPGDIIEVSGGVSFESNFPGGTG